MFPYEPFPFPVPTPATGATAEPLLSLCFNHDWQPYLLGAIKVLCRAETWSGTDAEIAEAVAQAQLLYTELEDSCVSDIQFRQHTDCILQVSRDGGSTWTDIFNAEQCITRDLNSGELSSGQGASSGPVPIGGCTVYHVHLPVDGKYVLPTTVNAGDQISISNVRGAWADGWLGNFWYCADSLSFVFGVCVGPTTPAKIGDPEQSIGHMNLLALVAGVYYNAYNSTFTLPFGVSNEKVTFLPNDDPAKAIGGAGSIDFDVEVCRNQQTYHLVDLRQHGAIITQTGANSWHVQQIQAGCDGACPGSFCSLLTVYDNNNVCHTARWTMSNQTGWTQYGCATHNGGLMDCAGGNFIAFEGVNLSGDSGWQDYFNAHYQNTDVGILDFRSSSTFEFDITATLINP